MTHHGIIWYIRYNINWNYGLFPQTWEDPTLANTDVEGAFGDNDPGNKHFGIIVFGRYGSYIIFSHSDQSC